MELTLNIKDKSRAPFLMELLKSLDYVSEVKEVKTKRKSRVISDLKKSLEEVKLYEEGKIKLQTFDELLNEL
jgi:galactokinase